MVFILSKGFNLVPYWSLSHHSEPQQQQSKFAVGKRKWPTIAQLPASTSSLPSSFLLLVSSSSRILDLFGAYPFWLHSWNYLCCLCYHQVIDHIHHFNFGWTMNNLSN
ncbi:hypothetical protein JHK82_054417 [Glycine max]|uniref:Uncharacterized protein n=2 Tax=Glycine subgen. Soja TaxID=1462606 RepID=K7MZQ6_SOYBN|nr:hypothetical protein JHK86_054263 [Glycine max]KAG4916765.1 hypothetical protein JHK87_054322 [Glycine soja]KAG4928737.1 hypothetical protein JHK85_055223 [Glycine max]KAG5084247.1 hypothetical protein JHK84_054285 [Glycine max]KAG5087020.1 hypothetical protein JHK82_054417 [Glycine max]